MRTLLYISGLGLAVVIGLALTNSNDAVADFSPRKSKDLKADAAGAAEVQRMLRGNIETGEVNDQDYIRLRNAVAKYTGSTIYNKDSEPISWVEMGPDNVGGRTRAILVVTESEIFTGGVSGGLWRSTNGGNNWTQIHGFPNCMVASIAQAGNGEIYVGTGSMFDGAGGSGGSGFLGRGVYRSTDGGVNWSIIPDTDPGLLGSGDWTAVDAIEADPLRPNRVYVGSNAGFGFIEGETYTAVSGGLPSQSCQDINIATDGSYMLVAMGSARVYRSTDNNFNNFEPEFGGNNDPGSLPQSGVGRARVVIAPENPSHAYALYATTGGNFGGVFYSSDQGQTWSNIWPAGIAQATPLPRNQGIYDLAIGVSPSNPLIAFVGGIEFWRVGPSYQAELAALPFTLASLPQTMHVDIHEIIFSPEGVMWVGNDGGIYRSNDNGQTYIPSNRGYNVTQYYGIDYTPGLGVIGGTQDNGSHYIPNDGSLLSDLSAFDITGGDGFDCAVPQVTDDSRQIAFTTSQYGVLYRVSSDGASSFIYDDRIIALQNADGEIGQFYSVIRLFEDTEDELSQRFVTLVNPTETTLTDTTLRVETANLDLPLDYTLSNGEELRFWPMLIRPELTLSEPLTEDPNYYWLDPQELTELILECDTTETVVGEIEVIDTITPIDTCVYIEVIDDIMCFNIGADTTYVMEDVIEIDINCDTSYFYAADTLYDVREQILVQDPYTVMLTVGFSGSLGVWMTRDPLNFSVQPHWFRLGNAPGGGGTKAIEYAVGDHEAAGDVMFVSGWNGALWRVSGLRNLQVPGDDADLDNNGFADALTWTQIASAGAAITGIAVDPNDPNHVVITVGGYGIDANGKVRETFNALAASPSWSNMWFASNHELARMPIYDAVIDVNDTNGSTVVVGTEYGAWITNDGGDTWAMSNEGMSTGADVFACPIFDLKQQWRGNSRWSYPLNSGAIYAGTHGRGIFRADAFTFVNVEENPEFENDGPQLTVYPNPVTSSVTQVKLDLTSTTDVRFSIYSISGRFVQDLPLRKYAEGSHVVTLNTADLANGNYILAAEIGGELKTARFIVMK